MQRFLADTLPHSGLEIICRAMIESREPETGRLCQLTLHDLSLGNLQYLPMVYSALTNAFQEAEVIPLSLWQPHYVLGRDGRR